MALALIGVATFLIASSLRMPAGSPALPGPAVMPLVIGLLLGLVSAGLLAGRLVRPPKADEVLSLGGRQLLVATAGLAWVSLTFETLGFPISLGLFLLVLSKEFGHGGWLKPTVFAGASVLGAWWFFVHLLGVQLPLTPF